MVMLNFAFVISAAKIPNCANDYAIISKRPLIRINIVVEVLTLPRVKFRLASDVDKRDVDCFAFDRDGQGRPMCTALNHPYCLQVGAKPCSFCIPRAEYENERRKKQKSK